mmetsp:Transcript_10877/g.28592  ORF Transcript_10877/g.28592 Transcript_10877/m.28592 type:complete len:391 (+) Transcript_10877:315-1487(+)
MHVVLRRFKFELGEPFAPFEQLMGVLPISSARGVLPEPYVKLMEDEKSPIKHYYPLDFELDLNGKKFAWQGIALLPFVDAKLLLDTLASVEDCLSPEEKRRNSRGCSYVFASRTDPLGKFIAGLSKHKTVSGGSASGFTIGKKTSGGVLFGSLQQPRKQASTACVSAPYDIPPRPVHQTRLLDNAAIVERSLTEDDLYDLRSGRTGWKTIRFSFLGKAAGQMRMDNNPRTGSRFGNNRGRGGGFMEQRDGRPSSFGNPAYLRQNAQQDQFRQNAQGQFRQGVPQGQFAPAAGAFANGNINFYAGFENQNQGYNGQQASQYAYPVQGYGNQAYGYGNQNQTYNQSSWQGGAYQTPQAGGRGAPQNLRGNGSERQQQNGGDSRGFGRHQRRY